jgi:outer membrane protein
MPRKELARLDRIKMIFELRSFIVKKAFLWPVLALAATLTVQAQSKVAAINIQAAIIGTKDGQKAAAELQAKMQPKKRELEQRQNDINGLQDQLNKGQNTMSEVAKNDLYKSIEAKKKTLQREMEDAQADLEADQNKLMQQLGQKIVAVIERYARDNGYTMVVDVGNPQTPVIYASPSVEITKEVIELYDKSTASASAPPTPAAPKPAAPAAPKPAPAKPPGQ